MSLSAQDYVELLELYSRSTRSITSGDAEGWVDLFTPEGVFYLPAIERFGSPPMEIAGRKALRSYVDEVISGANDEQMGLAAGTKKRYLCSNVTLTAEEDGGSAVTARGSAYFLMLVYDPAPRIFGSGVYEDRFEKTAAGWKIAHRTLTPDV